MKIERLFVIIFLLVGFTLTESVMMGGGGRMGYTGRARTYNRRKLYRPRTSYTSYGTWQGPKENDFKEKFIVPLPPPDRSLMENPKRLEYLAANRKEGKSNIGRVLSGNSRHNSR